MNTQKIFNFTVTFCLILTLLLPSAKASAEGNPSIQASTVYDYVRTQGWPEGTELTLTISGLGGPYTTNAVSEPISSNFYLQGYDIQPGNTLTVSGGGTTKILLVGSVAVTSVDPAADTVSGTAVTGTQVNVWVCDNTHCANRNPYADGSGNWTANFSELEPNGDGSTFDLVPGTRGGVNQFDNDGDWTEADWRVLNPPVFNPSIQASTVYDYVRTQGWPEGTELTLTISGLGGPYTTNAVSEPISSNFYLQGYDIQPGNTLTVSGGGTTKILLVGSVAVTSVDPAADTVSGTAVTGTQVNVWVCDNTHCANRNPYADGSGNWTANFSELEPNGDGSTFDLVPGTRGGVNQFDNDGDWTEADWTILKVAPLDSDGDGLNDDVDACPSQNPNGYDADHNGCTDTAAGLRQYLANLPANVVPGNTRTSLLAKVDNAITSFNRGKGQATNGQLQAFINEVQAQHGKKITSQTADLLIAYANNVIAGIP